MQVTTIGLDLGKNIFQFHWITADDEAALARRIWPLALKDFANQILISFAGCNARAVRWSVLVLAADLW
ncbi:MAG: hypothetical protein ABJ327_11865 [Litoreibacter sp.]